LVKSFCVTPFFTGKMVVKKGWRGCSFFPLLARGTLEERLTDFLFSPTGGSRSHVFVDAFLCRTLSSPCGSFRLFPSPLSSRFRFKPSSWGRPPVLSKSNLSVFPTHPFPVPPISSFFLPALSTTRDGVEEFCVRRDFSRSPHSVGLPIPLPLRLDLRVVQS